MLKKKHYVVTLSLAIISVLVGSLFYYNMVQAQEIWEYDPWCDINDDGKIDMKDIATVARKYLTSGTPINKTALLLELLDRVDFIEKQQNQSKTLRFVDPIEHVVEIYGQYQEVTNFTWIPNDQTNNAILDVAFYFEYKANRTEPYQWVSTFLKVLVGDTEIHDAEHSFPKQVDYEWSSVYLPCRTIPQGVVGLGELPVKPNQADYMIMLKCELNSPTSYVSFRNTTVILTVLDGLQ